MDGLEGDSDHDHKTHSDVCDETSGAVIEKKDLGKIVED